MGIKMQGRLRKRCKNIPKAAKMNLKALTIREKGRGEKAGT